jgi:exodeoxyribonuclease V alpha subunit
MAEAENYKEASDLQKIEGSVERVIFTNEENGYTICDLSVSDGGEVITVVGIMPMIGAGDHLCVYGKWVHNPKYGRQFSVTQYERVMPADTASILRYLASRAIKGIGPKLAQRIVDEFGADSFDVIENHPEWLASIKGMSMKAALAASESFREQAGIRSAMMFFRDYFGATLSVRIFKTWGNDAVEIAKENPDRTVMIVAHGGVIRVFWALICGTPKEEAAQKHAYASNASYSIASFDGERFIPIEYSIDSHLPEVTHFTI